jgi:hypothetical protein
MTEDIEMARQRHSVVLNTLIAQCREPNHGVRVTFVGHGHHEVSTCIHRTTLENLSACLAAIATLEAYPNEDGLLRAIAECPESIRITTYTTK